MTSEPQQLRLRPPTPGPGETAHARRTDPATSHAAAASLTVPELRDRQWHVLELVGTLGTRGICDAKLVDLYHLRTAHGVVAQQSDSGIRTRRSELATLGLVEATGRHVRLPSGRAAQVWQITPAGQRALTRARDTFARNRHNDQEPNR